MALTGSVPFPQVASHHLQPQCDCCGGKLACAESSVDAQRHLRVLRSIARHQGFAMLAEAAHWSLEAVEAAPVRNVKGWPK